MTADTQQQPNGESTQSPAAEQGPARVLVVDDNEQNRELLLAQLDALELALDTAADGQEALDKVDAQAPDLILLDIMMPKMSGYQVCKRLKSDPATRDIPIIMVTALNEISDMERAVESGTDEFISKPVNKIELLKRVSNQIQARRTKQQLDDTIQKLRDITPDEA